MIPPFVTMKILSAILLPLTVASSLRAAPLTCDMSHYQRQPGLAAHADHEALVIEWEGERSHQLRAIFAIERDVPVVRELALRKKAGSWQTLGRNLAPEFGVTTGIRRTNHGLPESNRWDVFWDVPLNHTNDVRRFT